MIIHTLPKYYTKWEFFCNFHVFRNVISSHVFKENSSLQSFVDFTKIFIALPLLAEFSFSLQTGSSLLVTLHKVWQSLCNSPIHCTVFETLKHYVKKLNFLFSCTCTCTSLCHITQPFGSSLDRNKTNFLLTKNNFFQKLINVVQFDFIFLARKFKLKIFPRKRAFSWWFSTHITSS